MSRTMELWPTGIYPCQWDDIINEGKRVYVTIYTLKYVKNDSLSNLKKEGIKFNKSDKVYDMIVDTPILTRDIVIKWLKRLSKITKINYKFKKNIYKR